MTVKLPLRALSLGVAAAVLIPVLSAQAPRPQPRILSAISNARRLTLPGSLRPQARAQFDVGAMPAATRLEGITLAFNLSAEQQANLDALLAAQQNPASPLYHQWLTPAQFGDRFGMAAADLSKVESWLQQQGFTVDAVAPSRTRIRFSGTVAQVEAAFAAPMHYFQINGVRHFAPATSLSLPAALAPTVAAVGNLDDFRPRARTLTGPQQNPRSNPRFTSSVSGNVFFAPGDIATVYDIAPLYGKSDTGAGQTIAIVGQSAIALSDIENFQNAAGLTVKDPALVLVSGSGGATVSPGDESESDLDLEWASAVAPGAQLELIYTGSNLSYDALDALTFAVDDDLAPIISSSYGFCEAVGGSRVTTLEAALQQAAAQGQTVIASTGDAGSTDCSGFSGLTPAQQQALAVDYPASSAYVTGVGGTEITAADAASGTAYWQAKNPNADTVSSALQYIPEVAWNDDVSSGVLNAGGGGASTLFPKPSWQTGVAGIPADSKRDLPDLALYASPSFPGFLFCTSDSTAWVSGQTASCNSGFRDLTTTDLTVAGGTSADAPMFAGMVAILNQAAGYTTGQGLINPELYSLAANSATYASAFHDVTTGNNDCLAGATYCGTSTAGFSAGAGYDQVTGLGSVALDHLAAVWRLNAGAALIATTTSVVASTSTPALNTSVNYTITVSPDSGSSTPAGTVTLILDNGTTAIAPITLAANGTAVFTTSFTTSGAHQLIAIYSGNSTYATSNGVVTVNVPAVNSGTGSIALTATALSVAAGGSGASAITVTPSGGYTGTVLLSFSTSNATALQNLCYEFTSMDNSGNGTVVIDGTAAASTQLTLDANAADCSGGALRSGTGKRALRALQPIHAAGIPGGRAGGLITTFLAGMGLLLMGVFGGGFRRYRAWAGLIVLLAVGLTVVGCGGGSSGGSGTASNPPPGPYTITVTGKDSATSTISATTTFTFTIQ